MEWKTKMPRPKKELETKPEDEQTAGVFKMIAGKSRSYQRSQKQYVEKLIPVQPIEVKRKQINGEWFEWVPCELVEVEKHN